MPFWLYETDNQGNVTLYPPKGQKPFNSFLRAQDYEDNHILRNAKIVELPTTDRSRAVQCLKAKRVDEFSSVQKGMRKFKHPKSQRELEG